MTLTGRPTGPRHRRHHAPDDNLCQPKLKEILKYVDETKTIPEHEWDLPYVFSKQNAFFFLLL